MVLLQRLPSFQDIDISTLCVATKTAPASCSHHHWSYIKPSTRGNKPARIESASRPSELKYTASEAIFSPFEPYRFLMVFTHCI
ncbi:hypothetical protein Ac2012v2_005282 [Leucoagaricus gongylophorus]